MNNKLSEQRSLGRRIRGVTMPISCKRMRWGRNWLCMCGSGVKYKKCCMSEINDLTASDSNARVEPLSEDIQKMIDIQTNKLGNGGLNKNE